MIDRANADACQLHHVVYALFELALMKGPTINIKETGTVPKRVHALGLQAFWMAPSLNLDKRRNSPYMNKRRIQPFIPTVV